jgi:hypothetical protein
MIFEPPCILLGNSTTYILARLYLCYDYNCIEERDAAALLIAVLLSLDIELETAGSRLPIETSRQAVSIEVKTTNVMNCR